MYFPYLRGRQFELIALRDFAGLYGGNSNVYPIIEPVRKSFVSLQLAVSQMCEKKLPFAVIVNPMVGEIVNYYPLIEKTVSDICDKKGVWMPAYIVSDNIDFIEKDVIKNKYKQVMIIVRKDSGEGVGDKLLSLISKSFISKVVIDPSLKTLQRKLNNLSKDVIRLDNNFKAKAKNSDYAAKEDELFSEEYKFYREDHFYGFSDFTVLPGDYIEGGWIPVAVAIHLTYESGDNGIHVRHFVSDPNDTTTANVQGKFGKASSNAIKFFNKINQTNSAIESLRAYVNNKQYPGLGIVKKISILNHLELMQKILSR